MQDTTLNNIDMTSSVERFKEFLHRNENIIITAHKSPDGDSVGSSIGLYGYLKDKGKNVYVLHSDETPRDLKFIDPDSIIKVIKDDKPLKELGLPISEFAMIQLDSKGSHRLGEGMEKYVVPYVKDSFIIDHHLTDKINDNEIIRVDMIATCQILYHIIKDYFGDDINSLSAKALYTGIYTDSGSFAYPRTTADTFRAVAGLIDYGANPTEVFRAVRQQSSVSKIKILGKILSNIKYYENNQIAVIKVVDADLIETGADQEDVEGGDIVNFPLIAKETVVSVFIRELQSRNKIKVSLRSKANYNVREVATKFGGGGHLNASGMESDKNMDETESMLVSELKKIL